MPVMTSRRWFCLAWAMMCPAAVTAAEVPVTTGSLVREMVDLRRLAEVPSPYYRTVQFSSYDRRSRLPGGPDWFGNADGFGGEPIPNFESVLREPDADVVGEYLICDVKGPGAIVRVWTAGMAGRIRMYLDGAEKPVFDGGAEDFLLGLYGPYLAGSGLSAETLAGTFQQRNGGYYPVPFAEGCKIVWTGRIKDIHFYHVNVRLYEPGTPVITFTPEDLKTSRQDIAATATILAAPDKNWKPVSTEAPVPLAADLPPRHTREILRLEGPRAIEELTLQVTAADPTLALRQTVMHVVCDDHPWSQIECPIGDFFGAAPGINPYDSLPFTVRPDGTMTCRWFMPFEKTLQIILDNNSDQRVVVTGTARPANYAWNPQTSMHLRARWRVNHDLVASNQRVQDIPFLLAGGTGRVVGTAIFLLNPSPVPTPGGCWWGEGDEKIFIDDDRQPSTFGTGTEDYFNYAWSSPDLFSYAYCGQPRNDGPANRGFVVNYRWHVLDDLNFRERLAFYMELYSHEPTPGFSYGRLVYHYGRPGMIDDHVSVTGEDLRSPQLPENWQPAARGGARHAVFFQAEELLPPAAEPQLVQDNLFAGGRMLLWRPAHPDDRLTLTLPVFEDGTHIVHVVAALAPFAGDVKVELDGRNVELGGTAGILRLHKEHGVMLRNFSSRTLTLPRGGHPLTFQLIDGAEGKADRAVGIDFVWVQRIPSEARQGP